MILTTPMKHDPAWLRSGLLALCALGTPVWAEVPAYKVDSTFGAEPLSGSPVAIAVTAQNQIPVLLSNGSVVIFDTAGKKTGGFDSKMSPPPSAMTAANGKIYLLSTRSKDETVEVQGKKINRKVPSGASCAVFTLTGTQESECELPEVASARDAHFIGDHLAVADLRKSQIVFFKLSGDKATVARKIDGEFRLCCGIFDFCPTSDGDSLLVANLGAFKVQTFTKYRKRSEFGARGANLEDFHGCCNPVNLAALGSHFIVSVEKAPTRVKICDSKGKAAKIIEGLGELVNGCSTIPVAIDSKGAIYLASATKSCIVKCVTDTPPDGLPAAPAAATPPSQAKYNTLSEVRDWEDAQSGHRVTGQLIAFEDAANTSTVLRDGKVRLLVGQKAFELPLARLTATDQEFVTKLVEKLAAGAGQ